MSLPRVPRDFSLAVQYALDQWLPPVLRDARWFMWPAMRLLFGRNARLIMDFRAQAFTMTPAGFAGVYEAIAGADLQGETDLNPRCARAVLEAVTGDSVLEVGAGRGWLAGQMAFDRKVTAADIVIPGEVRRRYPDVTFTEASAECLPYPDGSFDTVVCTHTLEHVQRLDAAVAELRRVCRQRLVIVVPRQRPYRYGFSLHVHFFPYAWSLTGALGYRPGAVIRDLGDWFYTEEMLA